MSTREKPQTSIYETTIENTEIEDALEKRFELREKASAARALFQEADEKAKGKLGDLDLGSDAPVRIGRFVVTRTMRAARSVSFETEAKVSLKITPLEDA